MLGWLISTYAETSGLGDFLFLAEPTDDNLCSESLYVIFKLLLVILIAFFSITSVFLAILGFNLLRILTYSYIRIFLIFSFIAFSYSSFSCFIPKLCNKRFKYTYSASEPTII